MTPNAVASSIPVQTPAAMPHLKAESKYATGADHRGQSTPVPAAKPAVVSPGCGAPGVDRSIPLVDEKKPVEAPKA